MKGLSIAKSLGRDTHPQPSRRGYLQTGFVHLSLVTVASALRLEHLGLYARSWPGLAGHAARMPAGPGAVAAKSMGPPASIATTAD